jgi:hypothetical protein
MHKGVGACLMAAVALLVGCGSGGGSGTGGSGGGAGISGGGKGGKGGGGGTSGSGTFTTSVPGSTPLAGLSGPQATQLCDDFRTYAETTLAPQLCKVDGLLIAELYGGGTDAQVQANCATGYQSCLAADGGVTVTCNLSATPSTCMATVGDFTSCLNLQTAATAQIPSCAALTAATLAALFADGGSSSPAPVPAACQPFQQGGSCASAVSMPGSGSGTP